MCVQPYMVLLLMIHCLCSLKLPSVIPVLYPLSEYLFILWYKIIYSSKSVFRGHQGYNLTQMLTIDKAVRAWHLGLCLWATSLHPTALAPLYPVWLHVHLFTARPSCTRICVYTCCVCVCVAENWIQGFCTELHPWPIFVFNFETGSY